MGWSTGLPPLFDMTSRLFSIVFAVALQALPLARVVFSYQMLGPSSFAIVLRWIAGASVALGGYHAVSGASTVIVSPTSAKGTVGVAFSYRITTSPHAANLFGASPLPPGLVVSTSSGKISGTPTTEGTWQVRLMASDSGKPSRTVYATLSLQVVAAPTPPTIVSPPVGLTLAEGGSGSLSVSTQGGAPLGYQWLFNGAALPGEVSSSLVLTSATVQQAGSYQVVVSNAYGSVTSSAATVAVLTPPSLSGGPLSSVVSVGDPVTFSVVPAGSAPFDFVWSWNGLPIPGATGPSLVMPAVAVTDAGDYTVTISNAVGSVTSAVAALTVSSPVVDPPTISSIVVNPGSVRISISTTSRRPCQVWASQDLSTWESVGTVTPTSGLVPFDDTSAAALGLRFYRVTVQ